MNLLALDTSTDSLTVAVQRADGARYTHGAPGGAQASATLIPAVLDLLARAGLTLRDLAAIAFGAGPGAFTGLRTACAVAQGLGHGAGVPLLPVDTLLVLAEAARAQTGAERVLAVLDARMDEVYAAAWQWTDGGWMARAPMGVSAPEGVALPPGEVACDWLLAGNALAVCGDRLPAGCARLAVQPDAVALLRLAPALLAAGAAVPAAQALPRYIRDKVAQTTAEREAARAAAGA